MWPHGGPKWPQEDSKKPPMTAQESSKRRSPEGTNGQKPMVFLSCFIGFWFITCPGSRQLKMAQEAPNMAPRGPKTAPK